MREVIKKLSKALNDDILWGIGGSILLQSYGIVDDVHDIDIIIAKKDIDKATIILDQLAKRQEIPIKKEYHTKHFLVYELDGISIDVMSSFRVSHNNGIYEFILDEESITKYMDYDDIKVPFTSLEDWLVAYQLMVNREVKVQLIKTYLETYGVLNSHLLTRTLEQHLPDLTKDMIIELLGYRKKE